MQILSSIFEVHLGILIHSLFQGCTSSYQWRCSPLDTDNSKYYLPDFGGRSQVLGYTWQSSGIGVTYIYDVDDNSLGCTGTVTAVEFCYTPPATNLLREVFTLLTLRQQNNTIIVTNSIPISFRPSSAECTSSKCCDVMTLMEQDQFDLPASNFLIGMTTKTSPNLPGVHFNAYPSLQTRSSYQLSVGQPMINSMYLLTIYTAIEQSLRLMWFHITPFPDMTTTPSMQQTTQSTTPSLVVSSSGDMTSANTYTSMTPSTSATLATPKDKPSNDMASANTHTSVPFTTPEETPSKDMTSANTHTSVPITTLGQSSVGMATGQSPIKNNASEVGGIIGVVIVFILIIFIVCMVLLFVLYRMKKYQSTKDVEEETIDNTVYDNINDLSSLDILTKNNEAYSTIPANRTENTSSSSNSKRGWVHTEDNVAYASSTVENVCDECNTTNSVLSNSISDCVHTEANIAYESTIVKNVHACEECNATNSSLSGGNIDTDRTIDYSYVDVDPPYLTLQ